MLDRKEEIMTVFRRLVMLFCAIPLFILPCWAQGPDGNTKRELPVEIAAVDRGAASTPATATKPPDDSFVIGCDDVLAITVWKETEISRTVTVRSDGKISLPLVGELQASAKTPKQLETEISGKLSAYISEPEVTVIVQEIRSQRFNILGQVAHPGSYVLNNSTTVLDAIAISGGFRDFAKQKSIVILRGTSGGTQTRIAVNYKEIVKGHHPEQNIKLEPGDTVVVP
jgi:polysaccharide biosynthesis/export protein